ncbi:MAG: hypothetical protein DMG32_06325 [Acidobacteria bacterium]|nr:MAG: hypothetical protein DMG32_06325 [Acidobacteriota bacterium]
MFPPFRDGHHCASASQGEDFYQRLTPVKPSPKPPHFQRWNQFGSGSGFGPKGTYSHSRTAVKASGESWIVKNTIFVKGAIRRISYATPTQFNTAY